MTDTAARILIVDDERAIREPLALMFEKSGYSAVSAADGEEAMQQIASESFDVVVTDIRLPGMTGVDVLKQVKAKAPETIVVLITAHASLDTAIESVREGASDYFIKPIQFESIRLRIRNLLRLRSLEWENRVLRIERRPPSTTDEMVGQSQAITELKRAIAQVAPTAGNVLVEGESGTGKEMVARAIHAASSDRRGAFVAVNCGSIPDALAESEFFGHVRGAFTGAVRDREGFFRQARSGTLFLDEVSELPLELQPKVLRAIETKVIRPLGAARDVAVDVRIVAATNRNLEDFAAAGRFREDLFFRLNVFNLPVPPLRDRVDDIALLARHFIDRFRLEYRSPVRGIAADAVALLESYPWRGNVRELQNVIQRALITSGRSELEASVVAHLLGVQTVRDRKLKTALHDFEQRHIHRVLEECGNDKHAAADRLGISLASLYSKLKD